MQPDKGRRNRFRKLVPSSQTPSHQLSQLIGQFQGRMQTEQSGRFSREGSFSQQHSLQPRGESKSSLHDKINQGRLKTLSSLQEIPKQRKKDPFSDIKLKKHRQEVILNFTEKHHRQKYKQIVELISQFRERCQTVTSMDREKFFRTRTEEKAEMVDEEEQFQRNVQATKISAAKLLVIYIKRKVKSIEGPCWHAIQQHQFLQDQQDNYLSGSISPICPPTEDKRLQQSKQVRSTLLDVNRFLSSK